MKGKGFIHPRGESGLALMMVMGVLAAVMLLLAHMMMVSQLISKEAYQVSSKLSMRYRAESAAETAFWLHLTDRRLFTNRTLGRDTATEREDEGYDPWMLDGRPHEMDEGATVVYLVSAETPLKVTGLSQLKQGLDASDDADLIEAVDDFINCYQDYVDKDDLVKVNSYEAAEYEAEGFYTLPRDGAMQFKEELYWLPNWRNVINAAVMIVPPRGIQYNTSSNSRPSFFTASDDDFCRLLEIEPESSELEAIHFALQEWNLNGTPVEETLETTLLSQVRNRFSFDEAGLATVAAVAADANRENQAGYRVVREARISSRTFYADRQKECFSIWERLWE